MGMLNDMISLANAGFTKDEIIGIINTQQTGSSNLQSLPVTHANYAQQAPVAQAPVAQAPVAQAPVAQAPVAQAPVAQAPVAQAPVAQAPVTQAPVTQQTQTAPTAHDIVSYMQTLNYGGHTIDVPPPRTSGDILKESYIEETTGMNFNDWLTAQKNGKE